MFKFYLQFREDIKFDLGGCKQHRTPKCSWEAILRTTIFFFEKTIFRAFAHEKNKEKCHCVIGLANVWPWHFKVWVHLANPRCPYNRNLWHRRIKSLRSHCLGQIFSQSQALVNILAGNLEVFTSFKPNTGVSRMCTPIEKTFFFQLSKVTFLRISCYFWKLDIATILDKCIFTQFSKLNQGSQKVPTS